VGRARLASTSISINSVPAVVAAAVSPLPVPVAAAAALSFDALALGSCFVFGSAVAGLPLGFAEPVSAYLIIISGKRGESRAVLSCNPFGDSTLLSCISAEGAVCTEAAATANPWSDNSGRRHLC